MVGALRAEWYDLDEGTEYDFLGWLHSSPLPRLAELPGVSWVGHYRIAEKPSLAVVGSTYSRCETTDAVPPGRSFVLLVAADSDFLLTPDPALVALGAEPRLAKRRNWREAVFVEEMQVEGPEALKHERDRAAPPAMQLGNFVVTSPDMERELAVYYRRHRLIQVGATPCCIGARKFVATVGWPKHAILYEFTRMDEEETLFEARINAALPNLRWEGTHPLKFVIHAPHAPHAGRRIWPPV
jgi:hypothetical protein